MENTDIIKFELTREEAADLEALIDAFVSEHIADFLTNLQGKIKSQFMRQKNIALERGKLLPCPFCGSEDIAAYYYNHGSGIRYAVMCQNCAATIDPGWAQHPGIVADLWNNRDSSAFSSETESIDRGNKPDTTP